MSKSASLHQRGFTLIEMSIVLVIIGLIIGGILKGQELIESARQKNLTSQIDSIRAGTNTFIDRFRAFPGDWGGSTSLLNASTVAGNDDGIVAEAPAFQTTVAGLNGINGAAASAEEKEYFNHLAAAALLGGISITDGTAAATNFAGGATASPLPQAALPQSGLTIVYGTHQGLTTAGQSVTGHWLRLHRFIAGAVTATQATIAPSRASQLDLKFDDGLPMSGRIRSSTLNNSATADACGSLTANAWVATVPAVSCVLYIGLD